MHMCMNVWRQIERERREEGGGGEGIIFISHCLLFMG